MRRFISILGLLSFAAAAHAHDVRPAYLEITEQPRGELVIVWKTPASGSNASSAQAPRFSTGWTQGAPATARGGEALTRTWRIPVPHAPLAGVSITIPGLESGMTDVLLRVVFAGGGDLTRVLRPAEPSFTLPGSAQGAPVHEYLRLGFTHIWGGLDHLMYVFGLVLLVRTPKLLLQTITGFTLAHSVSLAAAALGAVHVPAPPVEAVIALSIVYVAVELLRAREGKPGLAARAPWLVSTSIGLLHGLGFAGALSEVGLPAGAIPQALLLFNVGIELGQVAFVALVLAAGHALVRLLPQTTHSLRWLPPYAIGSFASFWVIERIHAFL
jgi:hypothetical protein